MALKGLVPELYCTDFDVTFNFYVNILGFEVLYQRPEDKFAYLSREGTELMFEQLGDGRSWITDELTYPFGRGVNFQITVTDAKSLFAKTIAENCKIFLPLEDKWYRKDDSEVGNRQFIVQDPDGFLLRFAQDIGSRPLTAPQP